MFPSDDEDDAVPLGDEFAMVLERRTTGATSDDHSSGMKKGKRPSGSGTSTKTGSSRDTRSVRKERRRTSTSSGRNRHLVQTAEEYVPSMTDLKQEEERVRRQEEAEVEQRRQTAQRLALERGLSSADNETEDLAHGHDVKGGAIIHDRELPSPGHKGLPLANPPPELPLSKAEPSPPDRPRSSLRDGAPEPKPPNESPY